MTFSNFFRNLAKRFRAFRKQNRAQRFLLGIFAALILLLLIPSAKGLGWLMAKAYSTGQSLRLVLQAGFNRDQLISELQSCREERSLLLAEKLDSVLEGEYHSGQVAADEYRAKNPDQSVVPASLIARSVGLDGAIVKINRGLKDGLAVGQTVISIDGVLLGTIGSVTDTSALVSLFFANQTAVPIMALNGSKTLGLARGTGGVLMELEYLPKNSNLEVGQLVVTSGIDGALPPNLLVGEVSAITADDSAPFYKAELTIPLNPLTIMEVLVITQS